MSIHQEVVLSTTPERVYELLTDGAKFAAATGDRPAQITGIEGADFSLFGGAITGRQVELVPGLRVVQAWRPKPWEPGHYSLVRFTLTREGAGTKLAIDHDGYPAAQHDHLAAGWGANYVEPFTKYFAE